MHGNPAISSAAAPDEGRALRDALIVDQALYVRRRPRAIPHLRERLDRVELAQDSFTALVDRLVDTSAGAAAHPRDALDQAPAFDPFVRDVMGPGSIVPGGSVLLPTRLLTQSGTVADDLALDAACMLSVAENVRRLTGLDRIVQTVIDVEPGVDPARLAPVAERAVEDLRRAAAALGLSRYEVGRVSALSDDGLAPKLHRDMDRRHPDRWICYEVAELEWIARVVGAGALLRWTRLRFHEHDRDPRDDRHVDIVHQTAFASDLLRVYAAPGKANEAGRSEVSPYARVSRERRPALGAGHGPAIPALSRALRGHLDRVAARLEVRLGAPPPGMDLAGRIGRVRGLLAAT